VSGTARAWLAGWRAAVPPSLAAVVEQAVTASGEDTDDVVAALSAGAVACLRAALRIGDDRAAALPLLAADALITAACEAGAGSSRALDDLATRFSAERLGTLFREELSAKA
jgi:electron transfer flavoprotein alpha/beta subunit